MLEPVDLEEGLNEPLPSDPSDKRAKPDDDLLCELDGVLNGGENESHNSDKTALSNGVTPNLDKIAQLYEKYSIQCNELERVEKQNGEYRDQMLNLFKERDALSVQIKDLTQSKSTKFQEVDRKLMESEYQLKATKDRLIAQENHFKKCQFDLSARCNSQLEILKKSTEIAKREKDEAVVKYAMRESEILNLTRARDQALEQAKQMTIERDALNARLRGAKNEKTSFQSILDEKISEIADLKKEVDRVMSFIAEADVKAKMAVKKADEIEAKHKETKVELDKTVMRLNESREETETIRADCQTILRNYQESADKEKVELQVQKQEHTDQEEIHKMILSELDAVKKQLKQSMEECNELKNQNEQLLNRKSELETCLEEKSEALTIVETEIVKLRPFSEQTQSALKEAEESVTRASFAEGEMKLAESEANECRVKVQKTLQLNEQLSHDNSLLRAELQQAKDRVCELEAMNIESSDRLEKLQFSLQAVEDDLETTRTGSQAELSSLKDQLSNNLEQVQSLKSQLEDEQNQNKVLKKKHISNNKDLKSELSAMKRRLEAYEAGNASACSTTNDNESLNSLHGGLMSSRASSQTSLDTRERHVSQPGSPNAPSVENDDQSAAIRPEYQQVMIEKIVKLQRALARRAEKIEFLEEHVRQLVEELQKKAKIIQMYALREETGALAPQSIDINKAELARRGHTIMGSVFANHMKSGDPPLAHELAKEIVGKMQAVLEDTLLKNITLKENIETLGQEISRLSRENRNLQLAEQENNK